MNRPSVKETAVPRDRPVWSCSGWQPVSGLLADASGIPEPVFLPRWCNSQIFYVP